ncbi:flagella synthesis protein FlgN [Legionella cardiaca]|uniref:Flagellar protein FlgN n=1 Tax=Legionella cardiaca TaxID=1071983 RepID=A0ABY8AZI2_9GAMM|nr:flagellar protein FlgN [Legionella cardiaca]WED44532.1 flagellar protein FlgN [Legionella cardiaca]
MTQSKPAILMQILQQEVNFIQKLINLLSDEKNALVAREFEELEPIAAKKQELSNQLEQCTKQRVELLGLDPHTQRAKQVFEDFLAQCSTQEAEKISALNKELAEKLILCRELNAVNGQVITSNINTRQEIINTITGQSSDDSTRVYTATGNLKTPLEINSNNHQKA